jgi:hypothetical protein
MLVHPHNDGSPPEEFDGAACDEESMTTFQVPLRAKGTGVLWWTANRDGAPVEHAIHHRAGDMYVWRSGLPHAHRPWPYSDFSLAPRIVWQAFGVQCGKQWLIFN